MNLPFRFYLNTALAVLCAAFSIMTAILLPLDLENLLFIAAGLFWAMAMTAAARQQLKRSRLYPIP